MLTPQEAIVKNIQGGRKQKKILGSIQHKGLTIDVHILNTKRSYGNVRYLVTPVSGYGEQWTENVIILEETATN
jgi:hypothetical protein